jgi:hypothetical protein
LVIESEVSEEVEDEDDDDPVGEGDVEKGGGESGVDRPWFWSSDVERL